MSVTVTVFSRRCVGISSCNVSPVFYRILSFQTIQSTQKPCHSIKNVSGIKFQEYVISISTLKIPGINFYFNSEMLTGDWGPFWVGLSVPVCCLLINPGNCSMFSCIEHKNPGKCSMSSCIEHNNPGTCSIFSCIEHTNPGKCSILVALSTKPLEMKHKEKPPEGNSKKISPLDNSDFGKFEAGYLNSKIPLQLFFEICHLKFN